jgi:uncharacterized membrane protein YraQ (UPF0718 family)
MLRYATKRGLTMHNRKYNMAKAILIATPLVTIYIAASIWYRFVTNNTFNDLGIGVLIIVLSARFLSKNKDYIDYKRSS